MCRTLDVLFTYGPLDCIMSELRKYIQCNIISIFTILLYSYFDQRSGAECGETQKYCLRKMLHYWNFFSCAKFCAVLQSRGARENTWLHAEMQRRCSQRRKRCALLFVIWMAEYTRLLIIHYCIKYCYIIKC